MSSNVLYAPWRSEYIVGKKIEGCVFCHISKNTAKDEEHKVIYRDDECFIVMNKYPYTPGHILIVPHFHTDLLEELQKDVWIKITSLAYEGVKMLKKVLKAEGVNIGMNIMAAAGAGIDEHLHLHLVPRWQRDTNFITTIGHTRVYGVDFEKIYKKLKLYSNEFITKG
jgi:diadenosine tetraphosphate (Ap4A) HIT family hydrolase